MVTLNKTFRKLFLRGIKDTLNRFISILGIVALGAGFLSGLLATAPDMRLGVSNYFADNNVHDINIKGTYGITQDDLAVLRGTEQVQQVMPAYMSDRVSTNAVGESFVTRIFGTDLSAFDGPGYINQFELTEGRMPENDTECVIVALNGYLEDHPVGEVFTLTDDEQSPLSDMFHQTKFTVVGIAQSPLFVSVEPEFSTVGNGSVDLVMYVPDDAFSLSVYTDAFLVLNGTAKSDIFTETYFDTVDAEVDKLSAVGESRSVIRKQEVLDTATEELQEAKDELEDAKQEADAELADAFQKIEDGKAQITDGKAALDVAQNELNQRIADMDSYRAFYETSVASLTEQKAYLASIQESIDGLKAMQAAGYPLSPELAAQIVQYDEGAAAIVQAEAQLTAMAEELETGKHALHLAGAQIDEKRQELAEAEQELQEAEQTYYIEKQNAEKEIADAEQKIIDAEQELQDLEAPEWYFFTLEDNVGFASYKNNTAKMAAIAQVFPVFFFLVAALVALTTMTRMVEEQRTQSGILKALGYTNTTIISYYLLYGGLAATLGCVLGLLPGFIILPKLISNAYAMMFTTPATPTPFWWSIAFIVAPAIILSILLTSYAACRSELRSQPAALLTASAPKPGKRIFLERISFIWNKLRFSYKVTARNLFRYKKRLFMTVVGVSGCTALLVAGFGIQDSISDIAEKQFGEIDKYNFSITLTEPEALETDEVIKSVLNNADEVERYLPVHTQSATVTTTLGSDTLDIYVPESITEFSSFVQLQERKSGAFIEFDANAVVITEKIAETLGIKVGDTVLVSLADGTPVEVAITGIAENYVASYLYMGDAVYSAQFQLPLEYKSVLIVTNPTSSVSVESLAVKLLKSEHVAYTVSTNIIRDNYMNSLQSVDYIVYVLIVAAGALAIIVLYNLTNINIGEREKELATLKVLGFYDREVSSYIFREINILSLIGAFVGFVIGTILHTYVIRTVEVDAVMFGREIYPLSYLYALLITIVFTLFVSLLMQKRLHRIDMVESMKAGD